MTVGRRDEAQNDLLPGAESVSSLPHHSRPCSPEQRIKDNRPPSHASYFPLLTNACLLNCRDSFHFSILVNLIRCLKQMILRPHLKTIPSTLGLVCHSHTLLTPKDSCSVMIGSIWKEIIIINLADVVTACYHVKVW